MISKATKSSAVSLASAVGSALVLTLTLSTVAEAGSPSRGFFQRPGAVDVLKRGQAAQKKFFQRRQGAFGRTARRVFNGRGRHVQIVRDHGNRARQVRQNVKMRRMFKQRLGQPVRGILKRPGVVRPHNRHVRFNFAKRRPGAGYRPTKGFPKAVRRMKKARHAKKANHLRHLNRVLRSGHKARNTRKAITTARKAAKLAKYGKAALAGTGVGAVVAIGASAAGLDPIELAALKATDPKAYARKMRALKKNPLKYATGNIKNNTKKFGCGVGNVFKKKSKKKAC